MLRNQIEIGLGMIVAKFQHIIYSTKMRKSDFMSRDLYRNKIQVLFFLASEKGQQEGWMDEE